MDLGDMRTQVSKGFAAFLLVVNIFTREAYTRPVKNKEASNVRIGLKSIFENELKDKPVEVIFSDQGVEFTSVVRGFMNAQGIIHRTKIDKEDKNQLAVLDRIMSNLKVRLAKALAKSDIEWSDALTKVTKQYNNTENSAVYNEPNDVLKHPVNQFMVLQDNAEKLAHNQKLYKRRVGTLRGKGAFRAPKQGLGTFKRGFRAAYGNVETIDTSKLNGSIYKTDGDREIDVKRMLPVREDTNEVEPRFALHDSKDEQKRDATRELAEKVFMYLGDGEKKSLSKVALMLKDVFTAARYRELLKTGGGIGMGALTHVLKTYWSDAFELLPSTTGNRENYYIQNRGG
jgi:hypothetical protein